MPRNPDPKSLKRRALNSAVRAMERLGYQVVNLTVNKDGSFNLGVAGAGQDDAPPPPPATEPEAA